MVCFDNVISNSLDDRMALGLFEHFAFTTSPQYTSISTRGAVAQFREAFGQHPSQTVLMAPLLDVSCCEGYCDRQSICLIYSAHKPMRYHGHLCLNSMAGGSFIASMSVSE